MAEAFSVSSRLTLSTNVEQVLRGLIEQFEQFDRVVKSSQEKLQGEKGSLTSAFAGLKLPEGLQTELSFVANFGREFAASSKEAASAWRQIAEAAKVARGSTAGGGGTGPRAPGGGGGGGRRGGGRGSSGGGGGLWGSGDDWPNARWMDQDWEAKQKHQADQKHYETFGTPEQRRNAMLENANLDKAEADRERAARRKFSEEYLLAQRENLDRDMKAAALEREERRKFNNDYALAQRENRDIDRRASAERKAAADRIPSKHDLGQAAMGLQMGGQAGTGLFESAIMTFFNYRKEMLPNSFNNELSDDDRRLIDTRAKGLVREVPGTTAQENVKSINELFTITNDLKASMESAKTYAQMTQVYEAIPGLHQGDHTFAATQSLELLQRIYDKNGKIDPEVLNRGLIAEASVAIGTGGRASPEDYRAMAKQSRAAGMLSNDQFLYEDLPAVMIALGGSRAGTAMAGGYREFARGTMTKGVAEDLKRLGILDKKAEWSHGRVENMDKHLAGFSTFQENQVQWVREYLLPILEKRDHVDIHDRKKLEAALTPLASTNVVLGALSEFAVGMESINKEAEKLRHTSVNDKGEHINPFEVMLKENPIQRLKEFHAAENEFMLTLGELVQGPALDGLRKLTDGLRYFTDLAKQDENKQLAKNIAEIVGGAAVLAQALGSVGFAIIFAVPVIKSLVGAFGLVASALVPFEAGGVAGAGLIGIAGGLQGLIAPIAALFGLLALGAKYETPGTQGAREQIRRDMGPVSPTNMTPQDGYGVDGRPLAAPGRPDPKSLVGPGASASAGSSATNPLNVFVTNQISEQSISRGVSSSQAKMFNRPPAGVSGPDPRVDPLGMFQGMVSP
jgi:hypothetical protein